MMSDCPIPCKYCGNVPKVSDVGGNNAYYGVSCSCDKGMVVEARSKDKAITCWNIFNEVRNYEEERDTL